MVPKYYSTHPLLEFVQKLNRLLLGGPIHIPLHCCDSLQDRRKHLLRCDTVGGHDCEFAAEGGQAVMCWWEERLLSRRADHQPGVFRVFERRDSKKVV